MSRTKDPSPCPTTTNHKRICHIASFLVVNGLCIWLGFLLCLSSTQIQALQNLNGKIAHNFYFGLNSICELEQISSLSPVEQAQLADEIDNLCYIIELCSPYTTFTSIYGDSNISPESFTEIQIYLQEIQSQTHDAIANRGANEQQILYFQQASAYLTRALSSETPLNTLYSLIKED